MYFFERAFRPFFLGGAVFAVLSMAIWWAVYPNLSFTLSGVSVMTWHAHEMVFGYALATVTGFLVTAVMNWSRMDSASGWSLVWLFVAWLAARIGFMLDMPLVWVALCDLAFNLGLAVHFTWPVIHKKLWEQMGLASKFVLLFGVNLGFYGNQLFDWRSVVPALTADNFVLLGLFLVLAINLTMIRRVLPFFTEKTLGLPAIADFKWVSRFSMLGFLGVMLLSVFPAIPGWVTTLLSWSVALLFALRARRWYHPKIWRQVLLWPLHLSYGFMILGMGFYGAWGMGWIPQSIAIHALAAGGIGLLCSAMMARISLGHTNRNVFQPPKYLVLVFGVLALGAMVRVIMPLLLPTQHLLWMQISQIAWVFGFAGLVALYWRILTRPSLKKNTGILL